MQLNNRMRIAAIERLLPRTVDIKSAQLWKGALTGLMVAAALVGMGGRSFATTFAPTFLPRPPMAAYGFWTCSLPRTLAVGTALAMPLFRRLSRAQM